MIENIDPIRQQVRTTLSEFPPIIEGDHNLWLRRSARLLLNARRQLGSIPQDSREYLQPIVEKGIDILRQEASGTPISNEEERALRAEKLMMEFSKDMADKFSPTIEDLPSSFVPIESLISLNPDKLRLSSEAENGERIDYLSINNPADGTWYKLRLPSNNDIYYKGGVARIALDIYADATADVIASELPWNDLDIVGVGDERNIRTQAQTLGVDPEGVEIVDALNLNMLFNTRDTTQNMVILGRDGLYFADKAFEAARTGHVAIASCYLPNKAIYNTDSFRYQNSQTGEDLLLAKQRGQMRIFKAVAEGKAKSFDWMEINTNLEFGLYALFLAKRWSNKPNFANLMQRLYGLLERTGQISEEETSIERVLERAHIQYPFFDFDSDISSLKDVAAWKARKLIKQIDREYGWSMKGKKVLEFTRKPDDTTPKKIDLEGFETSDEKSDVLRSWWPAFLQSCRKRTADCDRQQIQLCDRYFYSSFNELCA